MLRTYRIYNSTVGFSKYEFYYKLLGGITLLRVTLGVIWTQPMCIYIILMDRMVNKIQLTWKLAWMLWTYRIYNSMVGFSKYEFYYKLLDGITLLRVTLDVIWTQPMCVYIYIYIYNTYKVTHFLHCKFLKNPMVKKISLNVTITYHFLPN